jgi:RNA polymerase sigma-70 factor (ECF subfamily)
LSHELVRLAQAGDHGAFSSLVEHMVPSLYRTARLVIRDEEIASDAIQEALVTAWLDIRALRDPARIEAWLHRLLLRSCFREANRHRRRRALELHVEVMEVQGDPGDGAGLDARDRIDRGFRRLTPEQRAVLVLHHYLGLADAEAAGVLGIAAGTYKSRLHRATAALRAAIEADERVSGATMEILA